MYAVVETGGKQYRAEPGGFIEVERLPAEVGSQITLDRVLLVANGDEITVGRPTVEGATVTATVVLQARYRKVLHFLYAAKKRMRKKTGHRQYYTRLKIVTVQA